MRRRPQPSLAEMDALRVVLKAEQREVERLRTLLGQCKVIAVSAMAGDVDDVEALSEINNLIANGAYQQKAGDNDVA